MENANRSEASPSSLYGHDLLQFVRDYESRLGSAYEAAEYFVTVGGTYPIALAVDALGAFDRAAFDLLGAHRELAVAPASAGDGAGTLAMYANSLGRLHIRRADEPRPVYSPEDRWIDIGSVPLRPGMLREIEQAVARQEADEARAFAEVRRALDKVHAQGELRKLLDQVIDHVQHVESVCFYVGDRLYALIDRYVNLIDTKGSKGSLPRLRERDYAQWTEGEILVVAGLHALFLSGRSVRFEEFNGVVLSARSLLRKLDELLGAYRAVGCKVDLPEGPDIFDIGAEIARQAGKSVGKPWLRYRWIYALNFQKNERMLPLARSSEDRRRHLDEFDADYAELVSPRRSSEVPASLFFTQLASACLARDLAGMRCDRGSAAAAGWLEYLIEKIVASAVLATRADYGMSSSLRDIAKLVDHDDAKLVETVHALSPADFFTCFVAHDFAGRLDKDLAFAIAASVQKRMMFNRWHFIPGNFERPLVSPKRHWYYPPVIPDIAVHSDMHRAAHNRARVKFSVRAPGPDASRPPLQIAGRAYRGFYDVRVVRMDGSEFTTEEMLRTRQRTLWMESVYLVLTTYLQEALQNRFEIRGFQPGDYLDLPEGGGERRPAETLIPPPLLQMGAASREGSAELRR